MQVITNNHWRNLTYGYELSNRERADFDYIDPEEFDTHDFIRYRGQVLDLSNFMRVESHGYLAADWDGILADSFFSGIVVKLGDDCSQVKVGLVLD